MVADSTFPIRGKALGNDIGQQIVFDARDLIFKLQFTFLKPRQLQLIRIRFGHGIDRHIEIPMFFPQLRKFGFERFFFLVCHLSSRRILALAKNERKIIIVGTARRNLLPHQE